MRLFRNTYKKLHLFANGESPIVSAPLPGFDAIFYMYWYRDVKDYKAGPLQHFLDFGWKEGRDPCGSFSTNGYLNANPDVREQNINPLLHFLEYGLVEGRSGWQKDPSVPPPKPQAPGFNDRKLLAAPKLQEAKDSQSKP